MRLQTCMEVLCAQHRVAKLLDRNVLTNFCWQRIHYILDRLHSETFRAEQLDAINFLTFLLEAFRIMAIARTENSIGRCGGFCGDDIANVKLIEQRCETKAITSPER